MEKKWWVLSDLFQVFKNKPPFFICIVNENINFMFPSKCWTVFYSVYVFFFLIWDVVAWFMQHPTPPNLTSLARYCLLWSTGLTDLFLIATHGPKTHLISQGEYAHIRPSPKSSPANVGYYNPLTLRSQTTPSAPSDNQWSGFDIKCNTPLH